MLNLELLQQKISTNWLGKEVYYHPALPSTNDLLREMAKDGAPAGTLIITDFQSRGKGRLNRRWEAPSATSLLASVLFRPNWPADRANWLTMVAGLAVISAVQQETNHALALKWPNDVVLQVKNQWLKFAGLLLEANFEGDRLDYAVLGSGINVNIPQNDLPETGTPITSLFAAGGRKANRLSLLNHYLVALENLYETADAGQSPLPAWTKQLITLGRPVRVSGRALEAGVEGTAEGVDEWGRLLVRETNGRLHSFSAGDVTLRG